MLIRYTLVTRPGSWQRRAGSWRKRRQSVQTCAQTWQRCGVAATRLQLQFQESHGISWTAVAPDSYALRARGIRVTLVWVQVRDSKLVADREARSARGQTAHLEQELSFYQAQSASAMVSPSPFRPNARLNVPSTCTGSSSLAAACCACLKGVKDHHVGLRFSPTLNPHAGTG